MKFVISSSELLTHLQAVNRVVNAKNSVPILDNFLFELNEEQITITASDMETTLFVNIPLETITGEGKVAIPAKILVNTLKEFPEQPLTFEINEENFNVDIFSENGKFSIGGQDGIDFPKVSEIDSEATRVSLNPDLIKNGIDNTIFAAAEDELRPIMNGIFFEFKPEYLTIVASDSHKLVRYRRPDVQTEEAASFILAQKPANLLSNILAKEENPVSIEFDANNAFFKLTNYTLICRFIEGTYPSYDSVIPKDNPYKMIADRLDLYNMLRRVSVFSNQASNLVKLKLQNNQLTVSAQDIDFSISAHETLPVQYDGEEMEIGFKSTFLIEILSNLNTADVLMELSDPSKAGIFYPHSSEDENEEILMLLMPMML